jgi:hypothetical protein
MSGGPRATTTAAAVIKSGQLDKLTTNRTWMGYRKFKPRWVVLREDNFGYYEGATAGEQLKGCIPVALIQYAAENPSMEKHGFTVYAGEEPEMQYEFSANSQRERDEWIDAIMTLLHVEAKDRRRTTTTGQAAHHFGDQIHGGYIYFTTRCAWQVIANPSTTLSSAKRSARGEPRQFTW